jgi:hypothetical protein
MAVEKSIASIDGCPWCGAQNRGRAGTVEVRRVPKGCASTSMAGERWASVTAEEFTAVMGCVE